MDEPSPRQKHKEDTLSSPRLRYPVTYCSGLPTPFLEKERRLSICHPGKAGGLISTPSYDHEGHAMVLISLHFHDSYETLAY